MSDDQRTQRIVLARHAETEWSQSGRHSERTDIALTATGRDAAARLGVRLAGYRFDHVGSSPLDRALTTGRLAGHPTSSIHDNLTDWDSGDYEGRTTAEVRAERPDWDL